jgi:hypothetical protein
MKKVFRDLKEAVQKKFAIMASFELFVTAVEKDELWKTYLSSFPKGTNPIFRERTEHDCQCCKQFIRACGNVVAVVNGEIHSIWDIDIGGRYQPVVDALSTLVKSKPISNPFLHYEPTVGTDKNRQMLEDESVLTWEHFYLELPTACVVRKDSIGTLLGERRSTKEVFHRSLTELSMDALNTVLELIDQNSLYRGEENKFAVETFRKAKNSFDKLAEDQRRDIYCWLKAAKVSTAVAKIRNTAIGTLLVDLSEGRDLTAAVKSFEDKVSGTNYQRPTALITKGMIDKARKKAEELGFISALDRRYAVAEDLTINNVLFANREAKKQMGAFDALEKKIPTNLKSLDKVEEVPIATFIDSILPQARSLELLLENKHVGNMVSLVAPVDPESKGMFKWGNNFSWAYAGEVADSMRERVKSAGGNVEGDLRFSIQWNDQGPHNQSDYDAHCVTPDGFRIYYADMRHAASGGRLDVDIRTPKSGVPAIENIAFQSREKMPEGIYKFTVHNFSKRSGCDGFRAQIEFDGVVHEFEYPQSWANGKHIEVAYIKYKDGQFALIPKLQSSQHSREAWGIPTQQFHKVSIVMNSPNHWDGHATGNRHFFFMLEGCKNDGKARGFFNEFLTEELREHRKVFEVLGSQMKTAESDNQLSGLGFSSTQRNHIFCKVEGNFNRTIKLIF